MNTVSSQAEKIKEISGVNPLKCMKRKMLGVLSGI